jgi:hypothetical protein
MNVGWQFITEAQQIYMTDEHEHQTGVMQHS